MTTEELKSEISTRFPAVTYDETGEFLTVMAEPSDFRGLMEVLKQDGSFYFDFVFCLTCIDWKTHLMMVYHLLSRRHRHNIVVKVKLTDLQKPTIETVCDIWKTAELHEREVWDLFGVQFQNHPDMRRLFLDEGWPGHPLRKNYVDENMISI
jgi:NADH-quinone oxidoreductase subunit C